MQYDLVIIGGGSAGLTAVDFALELGLKTAIVESNRIGGDCTWTGCIPSKALLSAARAAQTMRTASKYGLNPNEPEVQLEKVMDRVRDVIQDIYNEESPEVLRARGLDVFLGRAAFKDSQTIMMDGEKPIRSKKYIIATGALPRVPSLEGLRAAEYYTYENIWSLDKLPEQLLILGAGTVGVELGQAFQRLGSQVTIIEKEDQILPQLDSRSAMALQLLLEEEGMKLFTGAAINKVLTSPEGIHLEGENCHYGGDVLLVSAGRKPNVSGLDLDNAGVWFSEAGIPVNDRMQTNQAHIYAAGDVTGGPQFTHLAGWQGFAAVRNAFLPGSSKGSVEHPVFTLFTDPEVAGVGLTMAEAKEKFGKKVLEASFPMSRVDRAHTDRAKSGFLEVRFLPGGRILGATIVSRHAGELIHEWALAISQGLTLDRIAYTLHSYPTYGVAAMQLAAEVQTSRTMKGLQGKLLRKLAR